MAKFKIGCSPLTNRIYAGNVLKNNTWGKGKKDITDDAITAVAQTLLFTDTRLQFEYKNTTYVLKVEEVNSGSIKDIKKSLLDARAEESNTCDLHEFARGVERAFKAIGY